MAERGGLYRSFFRNSLVFCHFIRKTCIFCCLRTSLSSLCRLSNALPSLQWTSKVPKKSNMSNKSGFASWFTSIVPSPMEPHFRSFRPKQKFPLQAPSNDVKKRARKDGHAKTQRVFRAWGCERSAFGAWLKGCDASRGSTKGFRF